MTYLAWNNIEDRSKCLPHDEFSVMFKSSDDGGFHVPPFQHIASNLNFASLRLAGLHVMQVNDV